MNDNVAVFRSRVETSNRVRVASELFGYDFSLKIEPAVFSIADAQAINYNGGYWDFYTLSNGGFYMAPKSTDRYLMACPNQYEGELSGDALGIVACLTAYSHLSFSQRPGFAELCANHYHLLRDYISVHPEATEIYRATD